MSLKIILVFLFLIYWCPFPGFAQSNTPLSITAENFQDNKKVALDKITWKYHNGDNLSWAAKDIDDSAWDQIQESKINAQSLPATGWNGRGWFRLNFIVDQSAADKTLSITGKQIGASEVYLDGKLLAKFGEIYDVGESEYNPNSIPIPFRIDRAGEHVLAVRYSSSVFSDFSNPRAAWLLSGSAPVGFSFSIGDASDLTGTLQQYASSTSMRPGIFFVGILLALAFLHFLLFLFYRIERANLFYSFYAAAFAVNLLCGNLLAFGHQGVIFRTITSLIALTMFSVSFISLLAFLHVAFGRKFGIIFWGLTALSLTGTVLSFIFLNSLSWLRLITTFTIFATISFSIYLLVRALIEKRPGAWILLIGVQLFALGMLSILLNQTQWIKLPDYVYFLGEVLLLLGIPVAVSIFLARNFARTNRDLKERLEEVKQLSEQRIEQERQAAELRVENERRTKELEEARQLQLSMLPKKLPVLPNLEIAAYMKPATEVGGDYYDFYVGADGTLTAIIGDATGHGLKAGSVVTATKSLFNAFAEEKNILQIFGQTNKALKAMNLRGLFMAIAMLKIRDNNLRMSVAGMPPMLFYKAITKEVEEVVIRAMPLGSISTATYQELDLQLSVGDVLVLMSDGFPEMFNVAGEMISDDAAKKVLSENAHLSAQEIINRFINVGESWAGARPPDDDVTFVVLKVK